MQHESVGGCNFIENSLFLLFVFFPHWKLGSTKTGGEEMVIFIIAAAVIKGNISAASETFCLIWRKWWRKSRIVFVSIPFCTK